MDQSRIRNFCIIAHIDHGKSTLADRLLELTGTIPPREMAEQVLDQMDLERERGITIKSTAVRMTYRAQDGQEYELNLIDTPGHVDFTYEVSRSLAAAEGAILVVDATQGMQAQTLANTYMAIEHDLTIIPVINKIDLPNAEPQRVAQEIEAVMGYRQQEMILASAKEGVGTQEVLEAVVQRIPPPSGRVQARLRALIFDSKYDSYKGVIAYLRVVDGTLSPGRRLRLMSNQRDLDPLEVGVFRPAFAPTESLSTGEVGYVATGLKTVRDCRVGDTLTYADAPASEALPGYRPAKPMVFAGLYPANAEEFALLRDALEKLHLNDAALHYEPEFSVALGPGFRCGFLGLLHMDIVQERLEREYDLDILVTAPSVEYRVVKADGEEVLVDNPAQVPRPEEVLEILEPWMNVSLITPDRYIGPLMELVTGRRGEFRRMEYLQPQTFAKSESASGGGPPVAEEHAALESHSGRRVLLEYQLPLSEMLMDFYDQLKACSQGYASMDYSFSHHAAANLVKLDILVNQQPVDALSTIVHADRAYRQGRALVERLRRLIPRQLFEVPIQAAVGGRIIARETIKPIRKNVLAKCYGGDVTRKMKLLEKQKAGKKRMKRVGNVDIPQEAFMAILRLEK